MGNGTETVIFILLLLIAFPFLGWYMASIFKDGGRSYPLLSHLERMIYRICQLDPYEEMGWKEYAKALIYFNSLGIVFLFFLQLVQGWLPLNPQKFPGLEPVLAFNTAVSFVTNTNWQAYGGESSLSYLTQMLG